MTESGDFAARHVLHSRDGELADAAPRTTPAQVRAMVRRAGESPRGLVLYVHGGLVGTPAAIETAKAMAPSIEESGGYPVFLVWETGLIGSLLDAFTGPARSIFGRLADAVAGLPALSTSAGVRADDPRSQLAARLRADPQLVADLERAARTPPRNAEQGAGDILTGVSSDRDALTPATYRAIFGVGGDPRAALPLDPFDRFLAFAFGILDELRAREPYGRLHGPRQSVLEECVRAVGAGTAAWDDMKADADRNLGPTGAVTLLLDAIRERADGGARQLPVTVIAHSAGSVIACHLIERWQGGSPSGRLDVVLLAPSVSTERFARTLRADAAAPQITGLRIFTMTDAAERADALPTTTQRLYEHSLLYFVSGACESRPDQAWGVRADVPLSGMRRFADAEELTPSSRLRSGWEDQTPLVTRAEYAAIRAVERGLAADPDRLVLTPTGADAPAGRRSSARSHEGFVWGTWDSIRHIVANGLADGG